MLSILLSSLLQVVTPHDWASYVDPLIGTDYVGNTYPGAQVPFGMVQLSPDNGLPGWDRIAGYFHPDSTIAGFSHTHLSGTGAGDLYDISFLPVTLPEHRAPQPLGVHSRFSHSEETAQAGYYGVRLSDYDIRVELTATPRCGIQRYTFPANGHQRQVILNLAKATNWDATVSTGLTQVDDQTVEGWRFSDGWARGQRVWFRTRFSQRIESIRTDSMELKNGKWGLVAHINFAADAPQELLVATALSPTGLEGARRNLETEAPDNDFDRYRRDARQQWNKELGHIEVEGGTMSERRSFYTALYHACLAPTLFCDTDGSYMGPDHKVHQAKGWENYSTFSLWDTYRAAHPLYCLICPERADHMARSLLAFTEENGRLPVWNMWASETDMMIGYHAASVLAEAVAKGVTSISARRALDACLPTARMDSYRGIGLYRKLGYVPYNVTEPTLNDDWALSRTLEYAYDDGCIASLAKMAGDRQTEREFDRRAKSYRNVYNPSTTFMQPRQSDGTFQPDFRPETYTPHICESNAWHYMWSAQHDAKGLIRLVGRRRFEAKLDSFFTTGAEVQKDLPIFSTGMIGQYAHGNEPSHHVAYFYNFLNRWNTTQRRAHQIMRSFYNDTPAGLCGNEDCGQMSAWLVFSAMGFYPFNPVSASYELGLPLFSKIILHLPSGRSLTITTNTTNPGQHPATSVHLNGRKLHQPRISHTQLLKGGTLSFD